jgi:hypothetical protein
MEFDINVVAGLVAGLAAMVPGSVIYSPATATGKAWMKEVGFKKGGPNKGMPPVKAMSMMLLSSLVTGLIASVFVSTTGASSVIDALDVCLILAWFPISVNLAQVFFEGRSVALTGIAVLNQVLTFAAVGIVLGLFL